MTRKLTSAGYDLLDLVAGDEAWPAGDPLHDAIAAVEDDARADLIARVRLALFAGATDRTYSPTEVAELVARAAEDLTR